VVVAAAASVNRPFFYEYCALVGLSVGGYLLYY